MITRRAALLGIGAALAAPAVVRAESLMKIVMPKPCVWQIEWKNLTGEDWDYRRSIGADEVNRFEAYTTYFRYQPTLVVEEWLWGSKILRPPEAVSFSRADGGQVDPAIINGYRDAYEAKRA